MIWDNYKRIACFPEKCSCEPKHLDSFVIQPFATITSLPFIFLGVYFLRQRNSFELNILASIFIILGFSSIFLHISLLDLANYFDFGSIFAVFSWVISFFSTKKGEHKLFLFKIIMLTLISTSGLYFLPAHPAYIFVAYFIFLVYFLFKKLKDVVLPKYQVTRIYKAIALVAIGGACFVLDEARIYCFEHFYIYGHAIWHLFVTIALYFQFIFFKDYISQYKDQVNDDT